MSAPNPDSVDGMIEDLIEAVEQVRNDYRWAFGVAFASNQASSVAGTGSSGDVSDPTGRAAVDRQVDRSRLSESAAAVRVAVSKMREARALLSKVVNVGGPPGKNPVGRMSVAMVAELEAAQRRRVKRGESHGDESLGCTTPRGA